jgi:AraC-like DNA-binding protein
MTTGAFGVNAHGTYVELARDAAERDERDVEKDKPCRVPIVVSRLDAVMTARLRTCYPNAIEVASGSQLLTAGVRRNADLVIADPLLDDGDCTSALQQIRSELPTVLVAAYTSLNPAAVRALLVLAAAGIDEVVLRGSDDAPSRFFELGGRSLANPAVLQVQQVLETRMNGMPPALRAAIARMFSAPSRFRTTSDLAAAAFMTRRGLYRHLLAAGIKSPRLLIASARVLRATALLSGGARSVREVAASLGYSKPELLSNQIRSLTGMRVQDFRGAVSLAEVGAAVAERL